MVSTLNEQKISGYFKNKSILITGSTGFLGKVLVEKVLRVQPDVKKIYLPVRAVNQAAAKQRVETEVIRKELFGLLREKHGDGFESFIAEKVVPLAGDMRCKDFGIDYETLTELRLTHELEVIVNASATTNFYERYDVALDTNVMGVKHMCNFAKKCPNLDMLLHVSTAYVAGEKQGLVQERLFQDSETLRDGTHLDIDMEVRLAKNLKKKMDADVYTSPKAQRRAMKDLGLTSSIHSILIGYVKNGHTSFLANRNLIMDVMPGDMVVNVMMTTMVAHSSSLLEKKKSHLEPNTPMVYHVSSSLRYPVSYAVLYEAAFRFFKEQPISGLDGRTVLTHKMWFIGNIFFFRLFMVLRYRLPLELLHLISVLCCGFFGLDDLYQELARKYRHAMQIVDLYGPFALFKGCFVDANLNKLRLAMANDHGSLFNIDPKTIDWDDYFYRVHLPGVIKYMLK
ncbi:probable fatty acyl-CoA reductase 4 isoform X2 [Hordeum vulgare subsp. vulgare]|uniref:probable fatty acyl-CoA reductase 4 isoform X2 n=1 Tax=Hordeum vulgare subsp. vulgare TaxID=112509 RepID=UPI001D1A3970|nr:probable fatty acyl-CoA reductase 4 isoform X2 [Hordeum vulgare subsp. vulgare]